MIDLLLFWTATLIAMEMIKVSMNWDSHEEVQYNETLHSNSILFIPIFPLHWHENSIHKKQCLISYSHIFQLSRVRASSLPELQKWVNWMNPFQLLIDLISELLIFAALEVN